MYHYSHFLQKMFKILKLQQKYKIADITKKIRLVIAKDIITRYCPL